jgi:hypothetical protein
LASLLEKAQWQPTPELSGIFVPGQIFEITALGHRSLAEGCVAKRPSTFTYTAADIVTSLQAGVSVGGNLASARGSGELLKKVKFGAPNQLTIPRLDLTLTPDCKARLGAQPSEVIYRSYVVQEVLQAEIAEQTCGRLDASGRIVGLGAVDAELSAACSQASLEPVAVGYRTVPLSELMGLPARPDVAPTPAPPVRDVKSPVAVRPAEREPKPEPAPRAPRPSPNPKGRVGLRWTGGVIAGLGAVTTLGGIAQRAQVQAAVLDMPLDEAQSAASTANTLLVAGQVAMGLGATAFGLSFIPLPSGGGLMIEVRK